MPLRDKVVLITGASRGVGEAVALACAREGMHVALAAKSMEPHPRLPGTLPEVAHKARSFGVNASVHACDVRFEDQVDAMVEAVVAEHGRLDVVVNNAGAIFWAPVADWTAKKFDLVFGVNVRGAFLVTRAAIPHIRKQGGHVVMMSPPINLSASVGKAPYLCSKIGMTMLAHAVDREEPKIAGHALWPVTAIKTAATVNLGMGTESQWRKPDILADATVALIRREPEFSSFRAWLDEEVLREEGVTDFSEYACVAGSEPPPLSIELVDPDWKTSP